MGAAIAWFVPFVVEHALGRDPFEQPMCRRVTERTVVPEQDQSPGRHLAPRRRPVMVEHLFERRP